MESHFFFYPFFLSRLFFFEHEKMMICGPPPTKNGGNPGAWFWLKASWNSWIVFSICRVFFLQLLLYLLGMCFDKTKEIASCDFGRILLNFPGRLSGFHRFLRGNRRVFFPSSLGGNPDVGHRRLSDRSCLSWGSVMSWKELWERLDVFLIGTGCQRIYIYI